MTCEADTFLLSFCPIQLALFKCRFCLDSLSIIWTSVCHEAPRGEPYGGLAQERIDWDARN